MHGELFTRYCLHHLRYHRLHPRRCRGADGLTERDLVTAEIEEPPSDARYSSWRNWTLIRTIDHTGDVTAHRHALAFRPRRHPRKAPETLFNGAVRIALGKRLRGRREDRDLLGTRRPCGLETLHVRHQHGVAHAGLALDARQHLGAVSHLRDPLGRDEGARLDRAQTCIRQSLDERA